MKKAEKKNGKKTESQVELGVETQSPETTEAETTETGKTETGTTEPVSGYEITLNKHSLINFKKGFYVQEKLDQYEFAVMNFAEQDNTIEFRFVNQKQKKFCYKIIRRNNSGLIFGSAFFREHFKEQPIGKYTPVLGHMKNNAKYYSIKI